MSYVKIGVGGPVGSGKTALIERLTREMSKEYSICVVTNDIYTKEDAEFLTKNSCLPADRIVGVETGGCPHTAIREDCSMNLEAVDEMVKKHPDTQIVFIESGGDNLSATFSPDLAKEIEAKTGVESRACVLGHIQRGGSPTAKDRVLATRMGNYAVKLLMNNIGNRVVAAQKEDVVDYDIFEALNMKKSIDMNLYNVAHEVSI